MPKETKEVKGKTVIYHGEDLGVVDQFIDLCHIDCGEDDCCGNDKMEFTGKYEYDSSGGFYVESKCLTCGDVSFRGDGDFLFYVADYQDGIFTRFEDMEEEPSHEPTFTCDSCHAEYVDLLKRPVPSQGEVFCLTCYREWKEI